jgi:hypothetical protein
MAQELIDKIRAAAQAKGIDPETALRIARAESSMSPSAQAKTSTAGGLFQVVDKTWKEFGGAPGKKMDADENIRVGTDIIAKNAQTLKGFLQRDPRPAELYAAHYFGPSGAKSFLTADPDTPIVDILGKAAVKANPNLQGKNVGQVLAQLETKMGGKPTPVSRETPPPVAREPLPPSLPPMAAAEEAASPMKEQVANLGPGYQAALALSFLSDNDDKEDRDVEKEPGIAEQWLAQQPTRPAVMAQFADLSIKSPFAEQEQPQMLADGGEVSDEPRPDVGKPTVQETYMAKTMFPDLPVAEAVYLLRGGQRQSTPQGEMLMGNIGAMVPMGKDANAMLMLTGSRPEREMTESKALMAAFNKRVGDEGGLNLNVVRPLDAPGGVYAGGVSGSYPMGEGRIMGNVNALKLPGQDPRITGYGVGYGGRVGPGNLSAMIMKQKDGPYSGQVEYRLPIGRADGGEVKEPGLLSVPNYSRTVSYEMYPGQEGQFDQRDAARHMLASGTLARKYGPTAAEMMGKFHEITTSPLRFVGSKLGIAEMPVDYEQDLHNNRVGIELGKRAKSQKDLEDLVQQMAEQAKGQRTEGKPWTGRPVRRADGGEVGDLTPEEIAAASKPAFLTPKSGIGRKISTKPGELEAAALQGVSEMPYLLAGAPVDLATMAMRPFGYDVEKPMFGSEDLKQRALDAGIRQKPPEGKAARALYELTQAGASAVNPAAPVRGAVAAAQKTGEAAKMLARNFQQYNQQLSVPGASYAVRAKGTPFVMGYGDTPGPDGTLPSMDQAEQYVRRLATTNDQPLNDWFSNKITPYLRRDFASPEDQFVQAADKNLLLHFAPKPTKLDAPESVSQYDRRKNLEGTRKMEGFPAEGVATTPYGKRVEALTDESAWPAWLEDITSPGLVPPSMRGMVETNPSARVTELGNIEKRLKFEDLRDGMAEMRRLGPEYSAYGQAPVKVPKEYMLTDESLRGLTPAQASNRVALFRNWRDDNRQRMATKYAKEDPNLPRVELPNGVTAVQLPDLQSSPNVKQLALDVGCDGNWCTRREASALDYGSGNNRLHILVDKKARPLAQITFSRLPPTKAQLEADPSAGDRFSITEMLGKDNSADFSQSPALPALQQYVKELDRQNGLAFVANLDKIDMKEISTANLIKGAKQLSERRQRYQPGISPEDYMAATQRDIMDFETAIYKLNGGSKYITKDQDMDALIQEALDRLAPQQRATGGMIERQSTDSRKYL